jgi:hypothetical protein
MESVLGSPLQALAALILVPLQFLCVAGITKILCLWWMLRDIHPTMSENDVVALFITIAVLVGVCCAKQALRIHAFWIELVSVLVAVAVCVRVG